MGDEPRIKPKEGSTAHQLEVLEQTRKLVAKGGVESLCVVLVMQTGELAWAESHEPTEWLALRGAILTAGLDTGGGATSAGLPDGEPLPEPEPSSVAPVVPLGPERE